MPLGIDAGDEVRGPVGDLVLEPSADLEALEAEAPLGEFLGHRGLRLAQHRAAVGAEGVEQAVPALLSVLRNANDDLFCRISAAFALCEIGDPGAFDTLVSILKDRREPARLRVAIVNALSGVADGTVGQLYLSLLREPREAAAVRRVTVNHLANERSRGEGPPFAKLGGRVFYPADELRQFIATHIVDPARRAG